MAAETAFSKFHVHTREEDEIPVPPLVGRVNPFQVAAKVAKHPFHVRGVTLPEHAPGGEAPKAAAPEGVELAPQHCQLFRGGAGAQRGGGIHIHDDVAIVFFLVILGILISLIVR